MIKKELLTASASPLAPTLPEGLLEDLRQVIDQARRFVSSTVNASLTMSYWQIGGRIRKEILQERRAEYGREIVVSLSRQLMGYYGKGFSDKNLRRMIHCGEAFPDEQIVSTLLRQLSWSHFTLLIPNFYAEMCRIEKWNVRTLRKKIDSMLFARTALSKKPESLVEAEIACLLGAFYESTT